MTKEEILKKIIENKGCCNWITDLYPNDGVKKVCHKCPIARDEHGQYTSCAKLLGAPDYNQLGYIRTINQRYLKKAEELLFDILVDKELNIEQEESD